VAICTASLIAVQPPIG